MKVDVVLRSWEGEQNKGRVRHVDIPDFQWGKAQLLDDKLELIFMFGQNDMQRQPMRSVSVGDVIKLEGKEYAVGNTGFGTEFSNTSATPFFGDKFSRIRKTTRDFNSELNQLRQDFTEGAIGRSAYEKAVTEILEEKHFGKKKLDLKDQDAIQAEREHFRKPESEEKGNPTMGRKKMYNKKKTELSIGEQEKQYQDELDMQCEAEMLAAEADIEDEGGEDTHGPEENTGQYPW